MLTYQITHSVLQHSLWGYHLTNALNSPQHALYALDEHGFVVFVLTQVCQAEPGRVKLPTLDQWGNSETKLFCSVNKLLMLKRLHSEITPIQFIILGIMIRHLVKISK